MRYLVVLNQDQSNYDAKKIHNTLTTIQGVTDWWHYLPNVYILDTGLSNIADEKKIADRIISQHPGLLFLVVAVNLAQHNGVLPKAAWDWINNRIRGAFTFKRTTPPPNDLLSTVLGYNPPKPQSKTLSDLLRSIDKTRGTGY